MFATLLGPLPPPPAGGSLEERIQSLLAAQAAAGLALLTDGGLVLGDPIDALARGLGGFEVADGTARAVGEPAWVGPVTVAGWAATAALTELPVKQCLVGPYTMARRIEADSAGRARLTAALAEALREELRALADAGCPVIQVDEDDGTLVGLDPSERRLFADAQRRLTDGLTAHLCLAVSGGDAEGAGAATWFDAPYSSYLFDLIAGPDNWRLIAQAPGDRGIVCGALDPIASAGALEALVWAARYAASTRGRGLVRVGLAPAAGLERLSWDAALERLAVLGEGARLATASREELEESLDWRALDRPWDRGKPAEERPGRRSPAP
jgi:methionine synthase II (cobalamin-independent)